MKTVKKKSFILVTLASYLRFRSFPIQNACFIFADRRMFLAVIEKVDKRVKYLARALKRSKRNN